MKAGTPSRTSEGTTAIRAREMRRPPEERICHDPYAEHFLSPFYRMLRKYRMVGRAYGWLREAVCPGLRGGILARTRYIDECLSAGLEDGIEQLVILGAGYDSRGYRLVDTGHSVKVFEVDHPATQVVKIAKVQQLFGGIPPHISFVSVDFCRDDLGGSLQDAGYDRGKKTFFIWEGVTYYLTAAAVEASLDFVIGNSGSGSSIVFDCFPRSVIEGTCKSREARNLARAVSRKGEPFLFGIDDEEIWRFLEARGFSEIEVMTPAACKEAWFHGPNKNIKVSEMFRFVHARHFC